MVAGACGGCNGLRRADARRRQPMHVTSGAEQDTLPYGGRAAAADASLGTGAIRGHKKSLCPEAGHRQAKHAGEGGGEGKPSPRSDRRRPAGSCPLRRRKLRASTAEMRPDGGPQARCGHRRDQPCRWLSGGRGPFPKKGFPAVMPCGADRRAGQSP